MYNTKKKLLWRRLEALVLTLCLTLSLIPAFESKASADYSDAAMDQLMNWGVVRGYPDGQTHPERELTRAEFVAMVNRAYGYKDTGETPFIDVPETAWYSDDISIAYNAGYFNGISPRMAGPENTLTREQTIVLLARNMRLDPIAGEVVEFSDGRDCAEWSRGLIRAAAQKGIITGGSDGSYKPQDNITRGQMAVMLQRALGTLINQPGTHTLSDTFGNVTISSPNTILKDSTIAGDLYITGGLELGDVTLDNVRVLGNIIVAGGGESEGGESIILRNVEADSLLVDSIADQYVSLRAEGNTSIEKTVLRSDAYLQDRTRPGEGLLNISLESTDPDAQFTLSGNLETVVNRTPNSTLTIAMGTVDKLTIDEHARDSILNLDINSVAKVLNLDTATTVTGVGDIDHLFINAPGSVVEMLPDVVTIRPGLTAEIAGETMDAVQAQESSSDPRLLAGYPKVKNIAPTSATAVYSTNKAGTVHWAVSSTIDGSIGEDELIDPTEDNTRILLSGNTPIESSDNEFTSALENLEPDSNYYLSAVLTDARDRHSPVKVASFMTPDNTVPAFTAGYPQVTQNDFTLVTRVVDDEETEVPVFHVQVATMPNKTCQLYYALYPAGSVQPTGQQFRTGSLGQPIQSGVEDVTKNVIQYIDFRKLDELTTYDLYLWLTDADGARSSQVQKLTFTTVDGTAPVFQYDTPVVTDIAANSIRLNVNVSEDATVYWVAVLHNSSYIKDDEHWEESAKRQIESGTGGISRGSVNVRKDTDATINIGGLTPATNYDVYYVAKDAAGNYSKVVRDVPSTYMLQTNTLDTEPPTAEQEFTRYPEGSETTPYANTDVYIVFSEDVMQFTPNQSKAQSDYETFDKLYNAVKEATTDAERAEAKEALGKALRATIKLYNANSTGIETVADRATPGSENNWVIDYREARVERHPEKNTMMVVFPATTDEDGNGPAIRLSSGSTYYFMLDDIADTSSSRNRMGRTTLPRFTTVSAQVTLQVVNVTSIKDDENRTIPIDMAFSMMPVSTNVESDVDWDIVFWSDRPVSFQIYELSGNSNRTSTTNSLVKSARTGVPSNITVPNDDSGGYIGRSLFRNFFDVELNPSVTGVGNLLSDGGEYVDDNSGIMVDGTPKYYGIHFTEVNRISEGDPTRPSGDPYEAWDETITFRVSVLTGTSVSLGNLASYITASRLNDFTTKRGGAEIQSPADFNMEKTFPNAAAPSILSGYPQFVDITDVSATMRVMLNNRAGKVYYAIAPVNVDRNEDNVTTYDPSLNTTLTITLADGTTRDIPINAYFTGATIDGETKTASEIVNEYIHESGGMGAVLSVPTNNMIYEPDSESDDDVKFGNGNVRKGQRLEIPLTNLTPDTLYFVYLVTESTSKVPSKQVLCYRFTTERVNRPKLWLDVSQTYGNAGVTVVSKNMNAAANYARVQMSNLPTELSQKFSEIIAADKQAIVAEKHPEYLSDSYRVLEALTDLTDGIGGSVYDEYASMEHKESLRKLIVGQTIRDGVRKGDAASLTEGVEVEVDCTKPPYEIQADQEYLFLAMARSRATSNNVGADTYGFAAYQPVYLRDETPPVITDISGHLVVDYTKTDKSYVIIGTINLKFDKDLYLYKKNQSQRTRLSQENIDEFQQAGGDSGTIRPIGITPSSTGDSIKLEVSYAETNEASTVNHYAREGHYFLANSDIASIYSTPAQQMRLRLNYRQSENVIVATISPANPWYPDSEYVFYLSPDDIISSVELVDRIDLNTEAFTINVGATRQVIATTSPTDADNRAVTWAIDDESIATIDDSGDYPTTAGATITGGYVVVRGKSEGVTWLYATSADGSNVVKSCKVTVNSIGITNVVLSHEENNTKTVIGSTMSGSSTVELTGSSYEVEVKLEPSSASVLSDYTYTQQLITVTSGDTSIATIDNIIELSGTGKRDTYRFYVIRKTNQSSGTVTIRVVATGGTAASFLVYFK